MTMALSAPLQRALFERLTTAPELSVLGGRVFDEAPQGAATESQEIYVTLGDESVEAWNTMSDFGAKHEVVVSVHSTRRGFVALKEMAALIAHVMETDPPVPALGRIATHEFVSAQTQRRENGSVRRIDLKFRFAIEDDAQQ